jgi:hypothetical protein
MGPEAFARRLRISRNAHVAVRSERSLVPLDVRSTKNCSRSLNSSLNCGCVFKMPLFVCEPMW